MQARSSQGQNLKRQLLRLFGIKAMNNRFRKRPPLLHRPILQRILNLKDRAQTSLIREF